MPALAGDPVHPALIALIVFALAQRAPDVVAGFDLPALMRRDEVDAEVKRELLRRARAAGGAPLLLALGSAFVAPELPPHPLVLMFRNCAGVDDLLDKQARLFRFLRPAHRLAVVDRAADRLVVDHLTDGDRPTTDEEALYVGGLLHAVLGNAGCVDVTLAFPLTGDDTPALGGAAPRAPAAGPVHRFALRWREQRPARPIAGLDAFLLAGLRPLERRPTWSERVRALIVADPLRRWSVDRVARACDASPRTVQRQLAREGTTLSREIAAARVDVARRLLADPALSVTEVGLLAGYADTAHFTRRFRAATGATPSEWRAR